MSTSPEHQEAVHTWKSGLKIFRNQGSEDIRKGCTNLLKHIQKAKYPPRFRTSLIDWCIWKYTTCHYIFSSSRTTPNRDERESCELPFGDKYAAEFYSKKAWSILDRAKNKSSIKGLRFDHVWERRYLRGKISKDKNSKINSKEWVGCVVTKDEHNKLSIHSTFDKSKGWQRYEGKEIWKMCDEEPCKCRVKDGKLIEDKRLE